jgi:dihydroxyacid dehydratase/phosphogluconate dehydratase
MDATTNIKSRLPSCHMTEGPELALRGVLPSVMSLATPQGERPAAGHVLHAEESCIVEIFKKTPYGTGLKRVSRYVAKDILEIANIPLLKTTLLDHSRSRGACLTATGQMIAEKMKPVTRNSHQDVIRSADKPIAIGGDAVGSKGNLAFDIVDLEDGVPVRGGAVAGTFNVKLTDKELAAHPTRGTRGATNHTSGTLWKYARQAGSAIGGTVSKPDWAHEKYCYADI